MGGLPTSTVNGFAVDPSNPKVMYVAMRDGIFRSDDAGEKWIRSTTGPRNAAAAGGPQDPFAALGVQRPVTRFPAPDLTFRTADGRAARLKELRGKIVLLGFFTTT